MYEPKPLFIERMQKLLGSKEDFDLFMEYARKKPVNSIRCNTLKMSVDDLKKRLETKGWKIKQPFANYKEAMVIENELLPGQLGNNREHLLGYYYVQELSSMLPILALQPRAGEFFLDLTAAPGSKTGQAAAMTENQGTIIANEHTIDRIKILAANLERMGVTNTIVTRHDAVQLCNRLYERGFRFDKILVDAPCSGEGTLRSSPKTFLMWNLRSIEKLSRQQRIILLSAVKLLREGGEIVYSTCTHAPEENERIVDTALKEYPDLEVEQISLPLKCRPGLEAWEKEKYDSSLEYACRVYPQDNDSENIPGGTEGFFVCKMRRKR